MYVCVCGECVCIYHAWCSVCVCVVFMCTWYMDMSVCVCVSMCVHTRQAIKCPLLLLSACCLGTASLPELKLFVRLGYLANKFLGSAHL